MSYMCIGDLLTVEYYGIIHTKHVSFGKGTPMPGLIGQNGLLQMGTQHLLCVIFQQTKHKVYKAVAILLIPKDCISNEK